MEKEECRSELDTLRAEMAERQEAELERLAMLKQQVLAERVVLQSEGEKHKLRVSSPLLPQQQQGRTPPPSSSPSAGSLSSPSGLLITPASGTQRNIHLVRQMHTANPRRKAKHPCVL